MSNLAKDITNQIFGSLVVVSRGVTDKDGNAQWLCKCLCGNFHVARGTSLREGSITKCKECSEKNKSLLGKLFGNLTVVKKATENETITAGKKSNLDATHYHCSCSCGNNQIFRGTSLTAGNYIQCSKCATEIRNISLSKNRKSNIGYTNNRLTIIQDLEEKNKNGYLCLARCECGKEIKINPIFIKNGNTKSCGCLKLGLLKEYSENSRIDLVGKTFTYLTVLEYLGIVHEKNYYYGNYKCKCICGNIKNVRTEYLKTGEVTSCGCKTPERLSLAQGGTGIPYEFKSLNDTIRNLPRYVSWRDNILKSRNYTCELSGTRGGTLHVHHINSLSSLIEIHGITKDNYNNFDNILYDDSNAIVLSENLHIKFHALYGDKTNLSMYNKYKKIITSKKVSNIIGQVFGKLTVVKDSGVRKHRKVMWECSCSCGNLTQVRADSLTSGLSTSCGCEKGKHKNK